MWLANDEQNVGLSLMKRSLDLVPTCKNILNTTELPVEETQATEILLFYKYVELAPDAENRVLVWQQAIGKQLFLTGRIHVGPEGIYGTCGGSPSSCAAYITSFSAIPEMRGVAFKRSRIPGNFAPFPFWHVQRTTEIIPLELPEVYPADSGALHTPPEQWQSASNISSGMELLHAGAPATQGGLLPVKDGSELMLRCMTKKQATSLSDRHQCSCCRRSNRWPA
mmetsp:Transcript_5330/g.6609  ORF Transcript_5330/g.6609 Transcript_5330/m.6609 type:complete len:224 (-) Transcript_5330:3470-4141(-)